MEIITQDWFHEKMMTLEPFEPKPVLAVGVSGGSDSLCLAYRTHIWAKKQGGIAQAIIIDHKARKESTQEAKAVQAQVQAWGMPAYVYNRRKKKGQRNTQTAWREDRYKLLWQHCSKRNIIHLLLGHHQDDVLETIEMRAKRDSASTAGLAPMESIVYGKHGRLLRPFATLSKKTIIKTMETLGIAWQDDPSNTNPKYERVHVRNGQQQWSEEDRTQALINAKLYKEQRKKQEQGILHMMLSSLTHISKHRISLEIPTNASQKILNNVLQQCLQSLGNTTYKPSLTAIHNLWQRKNATLNHCHVIINPREKNAEEVRITITTEKKRTVNQKKEKHTPRQPLCKSLYE